MKEINVKYDQLEKQIEQMVKILDKLDKPSYKNLMNKKGSVTGSGEFLESTYDFCTETIEFHDSVHLLIWNTIKYLEKVYSLKFVDQSIADKL